MTGPTSRLLTEADAIALVDRLQRSSTRSRPFIILGLIAVILGFVVLAWTLDRRLAAATNLSAEQAKSIIQLNATIANSQLIVSRNLGGSNADGDWHAMARLLNLADKQNDTLGATINVRPADLNAAVANAVSTGSTAASVQEKGTMSAASMATDAGPKIARLYIQIASPDQRSAAEAVAARWGGRQIDNATVVVPGIELVQNGDNTVRCTRADTCKSLANVTRWITRHYPSRC